MKGLRVQPREAQLKAYYTDWGCPDVSEVLIFPGRSSLGKELHLRGSTRLGDEGEDKVSESLK